MKKLLPIFIILSLLLSSCAAKPEEKSGKLKVYTSFYAMSEFAKAIGGDKAEVTSIVPVGGEPHDFEPTAADIAKISKADLFIYNGYGMDDWAKDVAETLPKSVKVVCASEKSHPYIKSDPHVWLSFSGATGELQNICSAMAEIDKANETYYNKNYNIYNEKLNALDTQYREAELSEKKLFVTHGAYGYLCDEWNMEQIALEGISGESDPSPSQMAQFVENMKQSGAKAIFYDPIEGDKVAKAAAEEAGVDALELYTFEGDSEGRDYVEIMTLNLEQLKKGL